MSSTATQFARDWNGVANAGPNAVCVVVARDLDGFAGLQDAISRQGVYSGMVMRATPNWCRKSSASCRALVRNVSGSASAANSVSTGVMVRGARDWVTRLKGLAVEAVAQVVVDRAEWQVWFGAKHRGAQLQTTGMPAAARVRGAGGERIGQSGLDDPDRHGVELGEGFS